MTRRERTDEIPFILGRFVQFGQEITDARSAMREIWIFLRGGSRDDPIDAFGRFLPQGKETIAGSLGQLQQLVSARSGSKVNQGQPDAGCPGKKIVPFVPGDAWIVLDRVAEKPI